ncbi:hypothetical protein MCOR25_003165 [Pyricularia grisea]|uniref:Uncharacterized protein n=1 Tax=Pyricularia grisea TaxID=148305 RepID=A0A6P8B4E7_PYRGI|nr:hypothetical protein PgNI_06375 [Pyricularia grisea]KAI6374376.1 hypothetical protein MCOR25_003165 [Pyricularia grisea]TLD10004.1 hypothetical protein PgNI_06375 [Pyricularia grisea]
MPPPHLSDEVPAAIPWMQSSSSVSDLQPSGGARLDEAPLTGLGGSSDSFDGGRPAQNTTVTYMQSSRPRSKSRSRPRTDDALPPAQSEQGWTTDDEYEDDQSDHGAPLQYYSPPTHPANAMGNMKEEEDVAALPASPPADHDDTIDLAIAASHMQSPDHPSIPIPETEYYPFGLPGGDDGDSVIDPDYMDVVSMLNNHDVDMDSEDDDHAVASPHQFQSMFSNTVAPTSLPPFGDVFGEFLTGPDFSNSGPPPIGASAASASSMPASVYQIDEAEYQAAMNIVGFELGSISPILAISGAGQPLGAPIYLPVFEHLLTNGNLLAPTNLGLDAFVFRWARQGRSGIRAHGPRSKVPMIDRAQVQWKRDAFYVEYKDLKGDKCDMQGVDWYDMGVTRNEARERRLLTYHNFVNTKGADIWRPHLPDVVLPKTDNFFRFRRMEIQKNTHLAHFQLRNLTACTSRSQVFYTGKGVVHQYDPVSGKTEVALNQQESTEVPISTIDAAHGVLVSGNFNGEYVVRNLNGDYEGEEQKQTWGTLTTSPSAITNHAQVEKPRRSNVPHAYFASNDAGFRVLDITTDTIVHETMFPFPINCSAVSPDSQLRVMVGDHQDVLVVPAEGGRIQFRASSSQRPGEDGGIKIEPEQTLRAHRDHGFACAWADDGWTIATGFQDRVVTIWDARSWRRPLASIRTEMAGCRSLRFSPAGSGQRVLVAAEEADFVNIIDARTFETKQTVDVFSEIGGVAFEPEQGRELFVFLPDNTRGGILQLERCMDVNGSADEVEQYRRGPLQAREVVKSGGGGGDSKSNSKPLWPGSYGRYRGRGYASRRPWDREAGLESASDATALPYDWPQENIAFSTRWSRQARARRRNISAALDGQTFF